VRTLLLDPVIKSPMLPLVRFPCISRAEALAEKLRAALSRRTPAIRDLFDIDYAVRGGELLPSAPELVDLVRKKMAVPGIGAVDVSMARLAELENQMQAQLRPVLRAQDFAEFDLERAFALVAKVAEALG
jgi:hypothetical protein